MPNLVIRCVKRNEKKQFVKNFKEKHSQVQSLPIHGYDYINETYKVYSKKDIALLYTLKRFIKKRMIRSDYELLRVLNDNRAFHTQYIKIVTKFTLYFNESFVDSLNESIYLTARKMQLINLPRWKQNYLLELDDYFKTYKVEHIAR